MTLQRTLIPFGVPHDSCIRGGQSPPLVFCTLGKINKRGCRYCDLVVLTTTTTTRVLRLNIQSRIGTSYIAARGGKYDLERD